MPEDQEFPSPKTYWARFGGKTNLVQRLAEYCQAREEYKNLSLLCSEYLESNKTRPTGDPKIDEQLGFVYLAKSGRYYKIGQTNHAGRREYELAVQLPDRVKTIHVIRTDDPAGIEAYWHKRFEAKRKNGEWFELEAADVAGFRRRKFM